MSYPQQLVDHLGQTVTTVCRCWLLRRRDGVVTGFTDHDMALTVKDVVCESESGFTASEAKQGLGLQVDSIDVEGALSSASITDEDIALGHLDGAAVDTFLVNWRNPEQYSHIASAIVGKIKRSDGRFVAELENRLRALDQPNGRFVLRNCDAELGDTRCKFALGPSHKSTGTVAGVRNCSTITAAGLSAFDAGLYDNGLLEWTSGKLAGQTVRVAHHSRQGSTVVLNLAAGSVQPEIGDAFALTAGCDKTFETCRVRFGNTLNFRGFPHLPGNDHAYSYATANGVFDGGPLVT
ncbi:MAG: DUF2163 domain-containing protein [Rhizobiaceae bacterium]|nr:DUF2163 domain-containing protein [Rhizobiaceae bacterium]